MSTPRFSKHDKSVEDSNSRMQSLSRLPRIMVGFSYHGDIQSNSRISYHDSHRRKGAAYCSHAVSQGPWVGSWGTVFCVASGEWLDASPRTGTFSATVPACQLQAYRGWSEAGSDPRYSWQGPGPCLRAPLR